MIAAHPDDEMFGCGGTMALLRSKLGPNLPISVLFVADGEFANRSSGDCC